MNLKETYNRIAEDWFKDHTDDTWWIEGTDKFTSLLSSASDVLDVGCGAGIKSKYLSNKGLNVTGIDFSEKFIEIARREVPAVTFEAMDMKDVRSLNKQFDGVFAQASLLHIEKSRVKGVIDTLVSVLKPQGYFYVAVKGIDLGGKEEDVFKENDYGYEYERFFSYYKMEELENYFKDLNLAVVYQNACKTGKTTWLQIIAQKT